MTVNRLVLLACLALPLAGQSQEVTVFLGRQSYGADSFAVVPSTVQTKTVGNVRLGYSFFNSDSSVFQVSASYQPTAATEVSKSTGNLSYEHGFYSVGAQFLFKSTLNYSVGVDYRFEVIKYGAGNGVNYQRPWARANVVYDFSGWKFTPFAGIEISAPLAKTRHQQPENMAPTLQVGFVGGVRF